MIRAYVFDAYGTIFDVHSAVGRHRHVVGADADRLSALWRAKQLEYTWVRSLMRAYEDFRSVTEQALDFAIARIGGIPADVRAALLDAYRTPSIFPDVRPVLLGLRRTGMRTAILSNGTLSMLYEAASHAGITGLLDTMISVEVLASYKTDPQVYQLASDELGLRPCEISFQSANRWDIAGAVRFGFQTAWVNRSGEPDEYGDLAPHRVLTSLDELLPTRGRQL